VRETLRTITADDYLGDLTALDMRELRARRATCQDVETGLSYLRRMVQGRLDVAEAERARRADRTPSGDDDLEDLIARLPELLAHSTRSPGNGRLPSAMGIGDIDEDLADELDQIATTGRLSEPDQLTDDELAAVVTALEGFERQVSDLRRALFDRIDAIEAELTRRYRTGEASVDSLLS
jgi:hypothetical protein